MFEKLILVDNPLVKREMTVLRNKNTDSQNFRASLERIAFALAIAVSENFETKKIEVETPLEKTEGFEFGKDIILVPVLRAGLSLVHAFLTLFPSAKVGHIGLQRNEETLEPIDYYFKAPKNLGDAITLVLDPMLATGGSASAAIGSLKNRGAKDLIFVSLIAAPEGVKRLSSEHPDVKIYTASLDRELNGNGYILPGLGDAGDRTFGTL
jgi:uracil phosphoribosyltransferase